MTLEQEKLLHIKNHFTEKGFVLRSGIKYGVDFLLYTDAIEKVHSKYAVLLNRQHTFLGIMAVQRVCVSCRKELVLVDYVYGEVVIMKVQRYVFEKIF